MMLIAMLILGFGPLNWSFPWWMWVLSFFLGGDLHPVIQYNTKGK